VIANFERTSQFVAGEPVNSLLLEPGDLLECTFDGDIIVRNDGYWCEAHAGELLIVLRINGNWCYFLTRHGVCREEFVRRGKYVAFVGLAFQHALR
jgi:hypothetical protein